MSKNIDIIEKAKSIFLDGLNSFQKENFETAERKFLEVLELVPDRLSAIQNLISLYIATNDKNKLKELLKKYNHLNHEKEIVYGEAYNFFFENKYSVSIKLCNELIKDKNFQLSAFDLLASNFKKKKLFLDALKIYKLKLKQKKDYLIYYNIGCLFRELGRIYKAIYYFNKSKNYKDNYIPNLWNLSLCQLRLGQFEEGFSLYEYRWSKKRQSTLIKKFIDLKTPKNLDEIKNKNVLISDEQGLGDAIQFSRFVIDLLKYTKKITFVINSKLVKLLSNLHKDINILDYENINLDKYDYHLSLCSLPKILELKKIDEINFYPIEIKNENNFKFETKNKLNIGISWSGNPNYSFDEYRSIPFKNFDSILRFKDINFYKLSQDNKSGEYLDYKSLPNLTDLGDKSIYEISKIIGQLDLVISSDTSIIHLAGILNVKSILLLNFNSDWRWFNDTKKTIWYPSVNIIKQKKFDSWENVFMELETKLKELIHKKKGQ